MNLTKTCMCAACVLGMVFPAYAEGWEKPQPEGVAEFVGNATYYLYNVGAQAFLNKGEAYGTQAACSEEGMLVQLYTNDTYGSNYVLHNVAEKKDLFRTKKDNKLGGPGVFTDGSNKQDADKWWTVTKVEGALGDCWLIQASSAYGDYYEEGKCFGLKTGLEAYATGFYYDTPYTGNEDNCHWLLVDPEAYDAEMLRYSTALELGKLIEAAVASGVDGKALEEAQAAYGNTASGQAVLDEAIARLRAVMFHGSLDEPYDVTAATGIADYKDLSNNTSPIPNWTNGLVGEKGVVDKKNDGWNTKNGTEPDGLSEPIVEVWSASNFTGEYYREFSSLPSGYYTLRIQALGYDKDHNGAHTGLSVFANDQSVSVDPRCDIASYYEVTALVTDGTLRVGIRVEEAMNWLYFADPTLTYAAPAYTTTIGEAGWGTLCLPFDAAIPTGVEAFVVTGVQDGSVVCSAAEGVEANKPLLLKGSGSFKFEATASTTPQEMAEVPMNGCLVGTYETVSAPVGSYVLQKPTAGLAFYKVAENSVPTVKPFRAWLQLSQGSEVNVKSIDLPGSGTTGMMGLETGMSSSPVDVYRMDGVRVRRGVEASRALEGLPKGIYVVGGTKKVVK